jgi:anaerobic dimethyl sulfoxide reductase subunit A
LSAEGSRCAKQRQRLAYKQRTYWPYSNLAWMGEAHPQEFWINPLDAGARGIRHGDVVLVYNDRGRIKLPAKVTS